MSVGEKMLDLLFPPKCPFCQKILDNPRAPLCRSCHPKLPWLEGKAGERAIEFADGCYSQTDVFHLWHTGTWCPRQSNATNSAG